jgi:hypothetical protein
VIARDRQSMNSDITIMDGEGRILRVIPVEEALATAREREAQHRRGHYRAARPTVDPAVAKPRAAAAARQETT